MNSRQGGDMYAGRTLDEIAAELTTSPHQLLVEANLCQFAVVESITIEIQ